MENQQNLKEFTAEAKNILIVCKDNRSDSLATAISIAKYIEKTTEKTPKLVYKGDLSVVDPYLLSLYKVHENIEPRRLSLSLNYKESSIEKLNWHKDEEKGVIVFDIFPVEKNFDSSRISHSFSGGEYDVIVAVGLSSLEELDDIYFKNKEVFEAAKIVNIDTSGNNQQFGDLNIIDTAIESLSGLLFAKFSEWKYIPDKDVVKSLLVGIAQS
jgi:nanoRNase/pAp phosphatase (c-di-AMP/oligoRNAs hydrolase)